MLHAPEDVDSLFQRIGLAQEFEPQCWIGEGSTAQVFQAVHTVTGRVVALKVWDRLSPHERRRFLREVDVMRQAAAGRRDDETGVVELVWAGETQGPVRGVAWVAMGLYECSLADRLAKDPPLSAEAATRICCDLLTGLATLHAAGILHRDVKPANVLMREGRAVISDFGLAARTPEEFTCLNAGTPGYVAPELDGPDPSPPTARCDVYAAGKTIDAVARLCAETLPGVDLVIARATHREPARRYASARELRRALDETLTAATTPTERAPMVRARASWGRRDLGRALSRRRSSLPVAVAGTAAVALGAAMTWPLDGGGPTASILLPAAGSTVYEQECFVGEAVLSEGRVLLLGAHNIDSVDDGWAVERVADLPPAGTRGRWQVTQYFPIGSEGGVGQHFQVVLASVPANEAPIGLSPSRKVALMQTATRLDDRVYRRAKGPGSACQE